LLRALAVCALVAASSPAASRDDSPTARQEAVALMDLIGIEEMRERVIERMLDGMMQSLREQNVDRQVMSRVRSYVEEEAAAEAGDYRDRMVELYLQYFTTEELRGLREWYATPLGQKMVRLRPTLTQRSIELGMEWGQEVFERALNRVRAEMSP